MLLQILKEDDNFVECKTLKNTHLKIARKDADKLERKTFNTDKMKGDFLECDVKTFKDFIDPKIKPKIKYQDFSIDRFFKDGIKLKNGLIIAFEDIIKFDLKLRCSSEYIDIKMKCIRDNQKEQRRQKEKKQLELMQDNTRKRHGGLRMLPELASKKDIHSIISPDDQKKLEKWKKAYSERINEYRKNPDYHNQKEVEYAIFEIRKIEPDFEP